MNYKESAKTALKNGCQWFQLRMDGATDKEIVNVSKSIKKLCDEYHAYFIIEDHVHLVKKIKANGVHLNQKDMSVDKVRQILGCRYIISVNAHDKHEAAYFHEQGADCTNEEKKKLNVFEMKIDSDKVYLSHIA